MLSITHLALIATGLGVSQTRAEDNATKFQEFTTRPTIDYPSLKQGFATPPQEAQMRAWWFWHAGLATEQSITKDLEAMKSHGYGGVILCDNGSSSTPQGPVFMSVAWQKLFAHSIHEATRLGIEISLNIQSGCGDPGNPNIANDNGLKKIVSSQATVSGPARVSVKIPMPDANKIFYQDIAIQAYRKPSDTKGAIEPKERIDLSSHFKDDALDWDAPAGEWIVIRYGMTSTGKRNAYASEGYKNGLCYDPIHKKGITAQWNDVAKPLIDIAKQHGTSLKFLHVDSWEMGMCNWTQGFMESFYQRRGYDMQPYLPVLAKHTVGTSGISERFLEDFKLTVADLVAEENYIPLRELAHAEGIALHMESAGPHQPPVDGLQSLGINDIPMGEAWARSTTHRAGEAQRMQVALGASAAHIYGKRFVAAEAPTSVGPVWERAPNEVKNVIDRIFCTGVNRINWHTYDSSPDEYGLPGIAYFAGTHFNRQVTWWDQSEPFVRYINRSQHMMTQGLHVADVLGYLGSRAPLFAILHRMERNDIPAGYSWDMCNADAFLKRAAVKDGRIVLPDGKNYALFALSKDKQMHLPLLRKIEQLVNEGMVLVGNPPQRPFGLSGYPESDVEFSAIVKRLWGNADGSKPEVKTIGKGKIFIGQTVIQALEALKIGPDLMWQPREDVDLEYIHYQSSDDQVDVYYVINKWARHGINDLNYRYLPTQPDRFINVNCGFRIAGDRTVERWDPMRGSITPVSVVESKDGYHHLPVSLEPEGGAFYVFRKAKPSQRITGIRKNGAAIHEGNTPLEVGAAKCFIRNGAFETLENGRYELSFDDGSQISIDAKDRLPTMPIQGPWKVDFLEHTSLGKPFTANYPKLISWTESAEREEKYFSGTARYTQPFTLDAAAKATHRRTYLDLGYVGEIATLRVNGRQVGILWKAPYTADITDFIQQGENTLEVDVTNLWVNRLIGDQQLPAAERKTSTNVMNISQGERLKKPDSDKFLRVSGLIGPVELRFSTTHPLKQ